MIKKLPRFDLLAANYPADHDAAAVKRAIGGKVDASWIGNTCAVRLSRAFNYAGQPIPSNYPGLSVVSGGDGKWYAYRVREFRRFVERKYGQPTLSRRKAREGGVPKTDFQNRKGLILFEVSGWSDATGHLTLWDGSNCLYGDYFNRADEVALWVC